MATRWCEEEEVWVTQEVPGLQLQVPELLEAVLGWRGVVESPLLCLVAMQGSMGML